MKLAKKLTRQQHGARRVGSQELNQNTPFHPNVESTPVGTQELDQDTVSTKTKKSKTLISRVFLPAILARREYSFLNLSLSLSS